MKRKSSGMSGFYFHLAKKLFKGIFKVLKRVIHLMLTFHFKLIKAIYSGSIKKFLV